MTAFADKFNPYRRVPYRPPRPAHVPALKPHVRKTSSGWVYQPQGLRTSMFDLCAPSIAELQAAYRWLNSAPLVK